MLKALALEYVLRAQNDEVQPLTRYSPIFFPNLINVTIVQENIGQCEIDLDDFLLGVFLKLMGKWFDMNAQYAI